MTFTTTRDRPGRYQVTHVETERQFVIYQHPGRWDWRVDEVIKSADGSPSTQRLFMNVDIWSKRQLLTNLNELIVNPPKPKIKPVYVPPPKLPPNPWPVPSQPVHFTTSRLRDGSYRYVIVEKSTHPPIRVWTDDGGWWHARVDGETQQVCTGMSSRKELEKELTWLFSDQ